MDLKSQIRQLEGMIDMCESHRNYSNWDLIDDQIEHIKELIKELEKIKETQ